MNIKHLKDEWLKENSQDVADMIDRCTSFCKTLEKYQTYVLKVKRENRELRKIIKECL